jgi:hypothetical protein
MLRARHFFCADKRAQQTIAGRWVLVPVDQNAQVQGQLSSRNQILLEPLSRCIDLRGFQHDRPIHAARCGFASPERMRKSWKKNSSQLSVIA